MKLPFRDWLRLPDLSPSVRREWIEMQLSKDIKQILMVSLRPEGVD